MEVAVVVATYGSLDWIERAEQVAIPSARRQTSNVIRVHGNTIAAARNDGAFAAKLGGADWLCFLDADDELEPNYLRAMAHSPYAGRRVFPRLLAPRVRYDDRAVRSYRDRNIAHMNPCVIGTLVQLDRFIEAGGFWEEPAWEDWSLFRRCWMLGSPVTEVRNAIYRAHGTPGGSGRNLAIENPAALHDSIIDSHNRWKEAGCPPLCW